MFCYCVIIILYTNTIIKVHSFFVVFFVLCFNYVLIVVLFVN